ncbi:MAG: hypothetical protein ACI86M_001580 [Saprospiraceae bacterium]|jgi:hypothetical protein
MKLFKGVVVFVCLTLCCTVNSQTVLVNSGSLWSYYDNQNEPSDQNGIAWADSSYNSEMWATGNAHLGYGDGDEATLIDSITETAYFRHSFNVSDPEFFSGLAIELTYDDGAIIYINGNEVWSVNMPAGTIGYDTTASSMSIDNAVALFNLSNTLTIGTNVVAVEVHQADTTSTDISFDLKVMGSITKVIRGPYLQKGSSTSMTVRWRTDDPTESIMDYGDSLSNLDLTYTDTTLKTEHIAELNGLSPNTKYFYEIKNDASVLVASAADLYFKTHPSTGTDQLVRMWILGDAGTANSDQRAVRDAYYDYVGTEHTDGILFLGDNAYSSGTDFEYQNAVFSNMYEDKLQNSIAWSCLGNHDGYAADANSQTGPYFDIFTFPTAGESGGEASGTEAYYSFDYGNIHFIALESYETDRAVGGTMYNWALSDIQNTTQEWIVAYWHHPPYSKGSHNSDWESNLIDMRENFVPMLESNGVDLVLSGHSHSYERSYLINGHYGNSYSFDPATHQVGTTGGGDGKIDGNGVYVKSNTGCNAGDGAVYITAGSSGKVTTGPLDHEAMFYSLAELGSCVLEVDGNNLEVKFIRETGDIEDYFTITKEIDNCIAGNTCDDDDPCTINDVYDAICCCSGTFEDLDNDGVCDADDLCPGFDDNLDSDGDGIPDGCDTCDTILLTTDLEGATLRNVIECANNGDTIFFSSSLAGDTLVLSSDKGQILIQDSIYIINGYGTVFIDAQGVDRFCSITMDGFLSIDNVAILGGNSNPYCIDNEGSLILENVKCYLGNGNAATTQSVINSGLLKLIGNNEIID